MAKFCTRCGRPLQEGEICNCIQQTTSNQNEQDMQTGENLNTQFGADSNMQGGFNPDAQFGGNPGMQGGFNSDAQFGGDQSMQGGFNSDAQFGGDQSVQGSFNPNTQFGGDQSVQGGFNPDAQFGGNPSMQGGINLNTQFGENPSMQSGGYSNAQGGFQQNVNMQNLQNGAEKIKKESMSVIRRILPTFKDPIGQIKDMANQRNGRDALVILIANIVVIAIISILAAVSIHLKLSDNGISKYVDIPYAKIVIVITLLSAIYDFGYAGCLYLSSKVFFREETTFGKMLSVVAGKILLDTVFIVAGMILGILNTGLGVLVISVGMVLTGFVVSMGYYEVSNLSPSKKMYAYFIAVIIFSIALAIIYFLIGESVVEYILKYVINGASSLFKGLY